MIMRYFRNKVENYKLQDRKSGREINEEEIHNSGVVFENV